MTTLAEPGRNAMSKRKTQEEPLMPKGTAIAIKGSTEWREWVALLAAHARTDTAKLVDSLLAEYARKNNLPTPPKR